MIEYIEKNFYKELCVDRWSKPYIHFFERVIKVRAYCRMASATNTKRIQTALKMKNHVNFFLKYLSTFFSQHTEHFKCLASIKCKSLNCTFFRIFWEMWSKGGEPSGQKTHKLVYLENFDKAPTQQYNQHACLK